MKALLKNLAGPANWNYINRVKDELLSGFRQECYAQEGEDMVLWRYFGGKQNGFYVDVGAHHPKRFSNTYKFYRAGWRGINIDAMPESMKAFNIQRKRDINLEIPVAETETTLTFSIFSDPALNGFVSAEWIANNERNGYPLIKQEKLKTQTLEQILDKHLPENQMIDFMSVDVEGLDLEVIKSCNWDKYRPELLLVEADILDFNDILNLPVSKLLLEGHYEPFAKTVKTIFYRRQS